MSANVYMSPTAQTLKFRFSILMFLCLIFSGSILAKSIYIQILGDSRVASLANRQFRSKVLLRPSRGLILDRNGEALAVNSEIFSLAANPSRIQNKKTLSRLIAKATSISLSKAVERLNEKKEFIWLKRHLAESEMNNLKKWGLLDPMGEPLFGLLLVKESKRVYPHGELAGQVLGSVNWDLQGIEGTELLAEEQLRGKIANISAVRDALGRPTFIDALEASHLKEGESIALTLDASLQFSVEEELKKAVQKTGARSGTVIIMNSVTGEILVMANAPGFNPNIRDVPASHRKNRTLTDGYEPGSTLKPILLAAAIQNGMKLKDTVYGEKGSFLVQGKRISEAESHEKYKWISLKKMIQISSNVGAAKLAIKLGADKYMNELKLLGFGSKTQLGFPGEVSGRVPVRKDWQPLTLATIGFGQGLVVTPLQMIKAYGAIANGGWLVQPTLLKTPLKGMQTPEPPRRVLQPKVIDAVTEALISVTEEEGTGKFARPKGYIVAGKTGTAQVVDQRTKKYSKTRYISSFIGFPVGVEPKLVIYTALDDPKGSYYASDTSAPLFKNILISAANRFSLPVQVELVKKVEILNPHSILEDKLRITLAHAVAEPAVLSILDNNWKMPLLNKMTAREALQFLEGFKGDVEIVGEGVVRFQIPGPGVSVDQRGKIRLTLGEP